MRSSVKSKIAAFVATLGPIGFLPMPGTMGTACAIPLLFGLRWAMAQVHFYNERIVLLGLFFITLWIVDLALQHINGHDPSEIVIDEVLGYFIVMMGLPMRPQIMLLAFIFFRFFDILKPLGITRIESLPGSWGIVLDDVVAAVFAHIILGMTLQFLF